MATVVILELREGSFDAGFPAILEIGEDGAKSTTRIEGHLPPSPHILDSFRHWQTAFKNKVKPGSRDNSRATARSKSKSSCYDSATKLEEAVNAWLNCGNENWQKIRDGLQQKLSPDDEIRVIIQTEYIHLRQLPWQAWNLFKDYYIKAEIALSEPEYQSPGRKPAVTQPSKVRILAVLGNSNQINIKFDREVLESVRASGAEVEFLEQPERNQLVERLWDRRGWHIFFFAGHSSSQDDGQIGWIEINQKERLEINEFKKTFRSAIANGLQLAIFNSCHGLGLANQLAKLHLPQSIVMREAVPDHIAQQFLRHFVTAFADNQSFYASVREARGKLEGWETCYPGASWLPVICQNPAVVPPTWRGFCPVVESNPRESERVERTKVSVGKSLGTWRCIQTLTEHSDTVKAIAISPDGKIIASGGFDQTIKLWQLETGQLIDTLTGHSSTVTSLAFSPDGQTLASSSAFPDGTIKLWNLSTMRLLRTLQENSLIVLFAWSIAFSPDGETLASGFNSDLTVIRGPVKLWRLPTGELLHTLNGHTWGVWSVAFTPDGRTLASGSWDGTIKLWNLRTKELKRTINESASFFDTVSSFVQDFIEQDFNRNAINSIAISPDGQIIASGGYDKTVKLWSMNTGELRNTLTGHSEKIESVAISPDGQIVASGSADKTIRMWNLHQGKLLCVLTEHLDTVYTLAFSPDGQTLVSGGADMTVKIWRLSA